MARILYDPRVDVPYDMLEPETLRGLIEHFVSREGTDYGEREISLETKIAQVMRQLQKREAKIVYDEESESCDIVSARQ